ncbi:MAG: hypothetical protein RLY88_944 [Actinomycetota bacterium]|jgi:hypothetical protein
MSKQKAKMPASLRFVAVLVGLEGLFVVGLAVSMLVGLLTGEARSFVTLVALIALVAAAGAWVVSVAFALSKAKRWARSATLFWQLVQLAVATGSFTGQFGNAAIGWGLILPSAAVLVALFQKATIEATMEKTDE